MRSILSILALILVMQYSYCQDKKNSAAEITNLIISKTGASEIRGTVDVFKTGDTEQKVTGIITAMFATMDVLKKAVEMKCNLIIVHEPVFYNHLDATASFENSQIYQEKKRYIDEHGLIIWRFHDYIHSMKPDGINYGMALALGWEKYVTDRNFSRFSLPETTLAGLIDYLKKIFPGNSFNVVGKPEMKVTAASFAAGAPGSSRHFELLNQKDVDVVIAGEAPQWESYEYTRDAVDQGKKKAIIFLGHVPSEEAGMKYCAEWIKGFIKDIPVFFVPSGTAYRVY